MTALNSLLNPLDAAKSLKDRATGNIPEGKRGVCSLCFTNFVECPGCSNLNLETTRIKCTKCGLEYLCP